MVIFKKMCTCLLLKVLPLPNLIKSASSSSYSMDLNKQAESGTTSLLIQHHYTRSTSDHSLFIKITATSFIGLLVYVDDVIIAGDSIEEFQFIKFVLHSAFKIKDLGQLKYFIGLEVAHSSQGYFVCERKHCLDLLTNTGYLASKPVSTSSDPSCKRHSDASAPYPDVPSYRRLIGRLIYLTNTRPDIIFATQQLSQFLTSPTENTLWLPLES